MNTIVQTPGNPGVIVNTLTKRGGILVVAVRDRYRVTRWYLASEVHPI